MVPPVLDSVERKSLRTGTAFNCCVPYSCDTVLPLDFRKCRATTLDTRSRVKYTIADVWHHTLHPFPVHTTTLLSLARRPGLASGSAASCAAVWRFSLFSRPLDQCVLRERLEQLSQASQNLLHGLKYEDKCLLDKKLNAGAPAFRPLLSSVNIHQQAGFIFRTYCSKAPMHPRLKLSSKQ